MAEKHTPEWEWRECECEFQVRAGTPRWGISIAFGDTKTNVPLYGTREKARESARLIAAAPATLAALEAAVACGMVPNSSAKDGGPNHRIEQVRVADQIRAAIAQAKGER